MCTCVYVHVCLFIFCLHLCRPEVGIHVLLDHSPPVSKVRGGVSHLNPGFTDKPSLASHLNWG